MELKRIQNVLTLNGFLNRLLNRKLKIKSDPLFDTPAIRSAVETRGIAILSYVPKLSEKLKLILLSHGIRSVFKPPQKLGGLLCLFKDAVEAGYWQGVIYKKNCSDCDQCYIGETKRWFETRKKEHMRDVKNSDNDATALFKHAVELGNSINWKNYEIFLQIELTTINANSESDLVLERVGRVYSMSQNPPTFAERVKGEEKSSLRRPNCLHFKTKANLKRHEMIDLLKEMKSE